MPVASTGSRKRTFDSFLLHHLRRAEEDGPDDLIIEPQAVAFAGVLARVAGRFNSVNAELEFFHEKSVRICGSAVL